MQKILSILPALSFVLLLAACSGNAAKEKNAETGKLKAKLEKLKSEKNNLDQQIHQLEEQLAKADPLFAPAQKLISIDTVTMSAFNHYIELQGKIDADGVAYVAPSGMGGVIKAIYVKAGDRVRKGQTLLKLDDMLAKQALIAAQQSKGAIKAKFDLLLSVYERRQNLWKQNIGTEIEVLNTKAELDATQSQLNAAEAQINAAREQLNQTNVTAEISGVIDQLNVKVGELFSPQNAANPQAGQQIKIVNSSSIKMVTEVPENYSARIKKGDKVEVVVPGSGRPAYQSSISVVGAAIHPTTRSFTVEAKLATDPILKPNQLATMKILDYHSKEAIVVSVNVVQADDKGKYVYVAQKSGDKMTAKRNPVIVGDTYKGMIEIKSGLSVGDLVITEGYQTVYDGQAVSTNRPAP